MQITNYPLGDLIPFDENPRIVSDEERTNLRESLREFGLFKPLLVWLSEEGPIVIGGNQRLAVMDALEAAGDLPLEVKLESGTVVISADEVPTVVFPGTWEQAKTVALQDNNSEGEWDWEALPTYVRELESAFGDDFSATLTGFGNQELDDLRRMAQDTFQDLENISSTPDPAEKDEKPSSSTEGTSFLTRRSAKVVIGNIRGTMGVDLYERWADVIKNYSTSTESTDLSTIMEAIAKDLEGLLKRRNARKKK